jgi:tetratricopeptide (TPR) repeat protein
VWGVAYRSIGAWDEAHRHLPIALEIRTRRLGEKDPATLQTMHAQLALGIFLEFDRPSNPEGRAALQQMAAEVLERRERVLGPEHPDTLTSLEILGTLMGTFGRVDEVEPILRRCLEARNRVLGPEHRDTLDSMAHLALLYLRLGRLAEAEPLLVDSLETRTRVLGGNHPDTLVSIGNLFQLYEMQGRHEEALPLRRESMALARDVLGDQHPYMPGLRMGLGSLCVILGHHEEAASVYEEDVRERRGSVSGAAPTAGEVFDVYWRVSPSRSARTPGGTRTAFLVLATSYDMIGRRADALALYLELLEHMPDEPGDERAGPFALFTVAWVLTRDHPEVNDPARAVDFARRAVDHAEARGTSRNLHMILDTLALALHQAGATADAIETERRAIASIPKIAPRPWDARTDETVRASYEARLRTYEASMAGQVPRPTEGPSP